MTDKKMIFFDIDGTLLPQGWQDVPESTKEALALASEKGHLLFINTGRTSFNIDPFIHALPFDGYVCGCGTYIFYKGQCLLSHTIDHALCIQLIEKLRQCRIPAFYEENNHIYFDTDASAPSPEIMATVRKVFGAKAYDLPENIYDPTFTYDKILAYIQPDSDVESFRKFSDPYLEYIDRGNHVAEIIQKGYSKATGIGFLCDRLNIPLENCYALGDSTNDLAMLEYVPHSIAMGNSDKIILETCSYITDDVGRDGVYKALAHFQLI